MARISYICAWALPPSSPLKGRVRNKAWSLAKPGQPGQSASSWGQKKLGEGSHVPLSTLLSNLGCSLGASPHHPRSHPRQRSQQGERHIHGCWKANQLTIATSVGPVHSNRAAPQVSERWCLLPSNDKHHSEEDCETSPNHRLLPGAPRPSPWGALQALLCCSTSPKHSHSTMWDPVCAWASLTISVPCP